MSLKDATEKLRATNDAIRDANELSDKQRADMFQRLNDLLISLLIAAVEKA